MHHCTHWRRLLWTAALLPAFAGQAPAAPSLPQRANVVFILADDIGYGDLGCYGATKVKTPHHRVVGLDPNDPLHVARGGGPSWAAGRQRIGKATGGKAAWWKDDEMATDLGETKNVAADHPEVVKRLSAELEQVRKQGAGGAADR